MALPHQPSPDSGCTLFIFSQYTMCVCESAARAFANTRPPQTVPAHTPPDTGYTVVMTLLKDQLCLKTLLPLCGDM